MAMNPMEESKQSPTKQIQANQKEHAMHSTVEQLSTLRPTTPSSRRDAREMFQRYLK